MVQLWCDGSCDSGMDTGYSGRGSLRKSSAGFPGQCTERGNLWNVPRSHHTARAKKNRAILGVVIGAMAVSTIFAVVPVLNKVSAGFVIIITTVLVAGIAAYFCPVPEEKEA